MENQIKGFIEVFPAKWQAESNSDNPYEGEYVASDKPVLINISTIVLVEDKFIRTSTVLDQGRTLDVHTLLSYDEIKQLIKNNL